MKSKIKSALGVSLALGTIMISPHVSAVSDYTSEGSYCAAIRGNGELMPAHWGSMARLTERYGLPSAMSGGSSASITMFLIESISLNKITKTDEEKALLIKSIEGYVETLSQTEEGKALIKLIADKANLVALVQKLIPIGGVPSDNETALEVMMAKAKHMNSIQALINSSDIKPLINPEMTKYISDTILLRDRFEKEIDNDRKKNLMDQMNFRSNQIQYAFKAFGNFDTIEDENLFFRPGLISFEKFAKLFGRMGDFYAGYELGHNNLEKNKIDGMMTAFIRGCGMNSNGKSWQEIAVKKVRVSATSEVSCRNLFGKAVLDYRTESKKQMALGNKVKSRVLENIGTYISTFPTTSVLVGNAVTKYNKANAKFLKAIDSSVGKSFVVKHNQVQFGYWGNTSELTKIKANLKNKDGFVDARGIRINLSHDKKSQKFRALGASPWLAALSTSPAEPGLAKILPIKKYNGTDEISNLLSVGGWDDLHPTLVLRALGCKNIMYVTRRGGDSMFGQGVIERLTHIGGFDWNHWTKLTPSQKRLKNAMGDKHDTGKHASAWSKLYNLSNPLSSFSKSLELADGVWCTNWDSLQAKNGMYILASDGYNAPLYNRDNSFFELGKDDRLKGVSINKLEDSSSNHNYKYSGCLLNK